MPPCRQGQETFDKRRLANAGLAAGKDDVPLATDGGRHIPVQLFELGFSSNEF
jgi:hypothetical protein